MRFFKEFRDFAIQGSLIDIAIGLTIGAAFGVVATSLVAGIIMPPIGYLLGNVDFSDLYIIMKEGIEPGPYASLKAAELAGAVTINYGDFINKIITFIVIAVVMFFIIRSINRLQKRREKKKDIAPKKDCPYCFTKIDIKATRCPNCTSDLNMEAIN